MKKDFSAVRLCVLVTGRLSPLPFETLVGEVAAGGADCIQLREKGLPDRELLERARLGRELAGEAIFIVNDRADVALLSGADGVHLGRGDLPVEEARRLLGEDAIIGASASSQDEIRAAERAGADYLGVGCVYPTATRDKEPGGLELVRRAAAAASVPFLAIGGITAENAGDVARAGAPGVAVCSAVISSGDPRDAAAAVRRAFLAGR